MTPVKITQLKVLAIAYRVACEYDYMPGDDCQKEVEEYLGKPVPTDVFEYSGLSPDEITNKIIRLIGEL
jgi:hypothetical protein